LVAELPTDDKLRVLLTKTGFDPNSDYYHDVFDSLQIIYDNFLENDKYVISSQDTTDTIGFWLKCDSCDHWRRCTQGQYKTYASGNC